MLEVRPDSAQTCKLLEQVSQGNRQALDRLLARHQPDLEAFSRIHLDAGLRAAAGSTSSRRAISS